MSEELYQDAIVALAKAGHGAGAVDQKANVATVDNPLCGDRVTVALTVDDGRIATLHHKVKGCLLCQAAASLLGQRAPGASQAAVAANAAALDAMLTQGKPLPADAWPELAAFHPVARHKSRFDCVRLPFQAAAKALND